MSLNSNIVFTSKEFHPKNSVSNSTFHFLGPSIDSTSRQENFEYNKKEGKLLVYFSLGTINLKGKNFYKGVLKLCSRIDADFIISTGRRVNISDFADIPKNCKLFNFVPQLKVLEIADVFVSHGGLNSLHESLCYSVPLIIFPQQIEQLKNAKHAAEKEVALYIKSLKQLENALIKIVSDPRYKKNAEIVGKNLIKAGGFKKAADFVESLC